MPRDLQLLAAKAWDRQLAAMAAVGAAARVAATVCADGPDAQDDADAELALALRRTDNEMAYQLHQDRQLLTLPVLYGVLHAGDCTLRHVSAFLDITRDVPLDNVLAIDEAVSERAASMTVSGLVEWSARRQRGSTPDHPRRRSRHGVRASVCVAGLSRTGSSPSRPPCQRQTGSPWRRSSTVVPMPRARRTMTARTANVRSTCCSMLCWVAGKWRRPMVRSRRGQPARRVAPSCKSSSTGGLCWVCATTRPS